MFIPVKAFINLINKFWILSTNYCADKKWINSEENTQITLISKQQIISFVGTDFIEKQSGTGPNYFLQFTQHYFSHALLYV